MSKIFLLNPNVRYQPKDVVKSIHDNRIAFGLQSWDSRDSEIAKALKKGCTLKHVHGRVVAMINMEVKNTHKFANGTQIRRERKYNNLNFREVNPVNAIVVSAEHIKEGSEILVDYAAVHDSNKVFDYNTGSPDVFVYSFREDDCYAYRDERNRWQPTETSEFGLRVYKPYEGVIEGITPALIKDVLYVTTGMLKGRVARTLKACDYQIVFQEDDGKEGNIIRFRHSNDSNFEREEVIGIADDLTELVNSDKLLIGLSANKAKPISNII